MTTLRTTTRFELPFTETTKSIWSSNHHNNNNFNQVLSIFDKSTAKDERSLPLLIDDRSHVTSVVFVPEEDEENSNGNNHEKNIDGTKSKKPTDQEVPFSKFYGGDIEMTFHKNSNLLLPPTCSILLLHSLLRLTKNDENASPNSIFLSSEQEATLSQEQRDFILKIASVDAAKIEFVSQNLENLIDLFLPVIRRKENGLDESNDDDLFKFVFSSDDKEKEDSKPSVTTHFITLDDVSEFYDNHELLDRLLFSYSIILISFGWKIHNLQDGTVDRIGKFWKEIYAKNSALSSEQEKLIRNVTRILRSLIDFRLRKVATKFVQFIWEELCVGRLGFLRNVWELVWMPMVLVKGYYKDSEEDKDEDATWHFDEEQREKWLDKLIEIEQGSSDDDE